MDKNKEKMLREFKSARPIYDAFSNKVESLIKNILDESNVNVHSVSSRTKDFDIFKEKISRVGKEYAKFTDVTDLSGVRIICLFAGQLDEIAKIIEENFTIYPEMSVDKRQILDPDRFGYLSLHYIVTLTGERVELKEYKRYAGLFCEIQIRSVLQHAWAEIVHDLGYKSKIEIPREFMRRFYRLAGLLELADNEFDNLQECITNYQDKVDNAITTRPEDLLIDKISLTKYLESSEYTKEIDNEIAKFMNAQLTPCRVGEYDFKIINFLEIKTIRELDKVLKVNKRGIINFAELWIGDSTYETIDGGISLFYMGYYIVGKTDDAKKINSYVDLFRFDDNSYAKAKILEVSMQLKNK